MRRIDKGTPLPDFQRGTVGLTRWGELQETRRFRDHILSIEQKGLSAYTERQVELDKTHIDHFCKRDLFPAKCFDWDNLLVAENDEGYGAKYKDNKYKLNNGDYNLIINPVVDDPHDYFTYMPNGDITPKCGLGDSDLQKAQKTIEVFNLNHPALVNERRTHWGYVEYYTQAGLSKLEILEYSPAFPSLTEYITSLL